MNCSSTAVVNGKPLTTIKNLKKLNLGQSTGKGKTPFIDVTPLESCTQLTELTLSGSKVSDKKAIALSKQLPNTVIIYGGVTSKKRIEPEKQERHKTKLQSSLPDWMLDKDGRWLRRQFPVASLREAASRLGSIAEILSEDLPKTKITIGNGSLGPGSLHTMKIGNFFEIF